MQTKSESVLVTTSFRVELEVLEQFRAKARENYRSPSWEIRRLMNEYLNGDKEPAS